MTDRNRSWIPAAAAAAAAGLLAALYTPLTGAETVLIGDQVTVRKSDVPRPSGGMTMSAVEARFGSPRERHPAVGTPPITRWDYDRFAVFFEKDRVIDAVVPPTAAPPVTTADNQAPSAVAAGSAGTAGSEATAVASPTAAPAAPPSPAAPAPAAAPKPTATP